MAGTPLLLVLAEGQPSMLFFQRLLYTAYLLAASIVFHHKEIFIEMSKAFTEWVRAPMEMMSTPVAATA